MQAASAIANCAWTCGSLGAWRRFRRALYDPQRAQAQILMRCLRANADTQVGRILRFSDIQSVDEFRRRVPLCTFESIASSVERIMRGERNILTSEPVDRLVPTSGSSGGRKLIPWTRVLHREFNAAIAPWIVDMFRRRPSLIGGPAYWSISPVGAFERDLESAVPTGFDDDTAYLGGIARRLVASTLAAPSALRLIGEIESLRYATLVFLLRCRELRLISVWHPTFLLLLLDALSSNWTRLIADVADGRLSGAEGLSKNVLEQLRPFLRADQRRARHLERLSPSQLQSVWPRLGVISCWTDGFAANSCGALRQALPHAAIEPKGLVATECIVSLPFDGLRPIAVRSHFFEFLDEDGASRLAHELETGRSYSVVVTTGGGLYRYQTRDRVRVDGWLHRTPSLVFLGKQDGVCDLFGEKLGQEFVAAVVNEVLEWLPARPSFAMLAPEFANGRWGYVLHLDCDDGLVLPSLAARLDRLLSANPHYRYCVELGQLAPAAVVQTRPGALDRYVAELCRQGQRAGEIKPSALNAKPGWCAVLGTVRPNPPTWRACGYRPRHSG